MSARRCVWLCVCVCVCVSALQGVNGPSFADPASQQTHAQLHLFNISRRRRGHEEEAAVFVMSSAQPEQSQGPGPQSAPQAGQAGHLGQGHSEGATQAIIRPGDRGLPLQAGDIIVLGTAHSAPRYRVERWAGSAAGLEQAGLGSAAQAQALHTAPLAAALARHATATPPPAAAAPSLQALAQLARTAPQEADAEYRRACTGAQRHNAFAWIAWAQLCARRGQPRRARDLFRAAVAAAQAAASTSPHPTQSPSTPTSPTYSQTPESLHTHIPQTPLSDQPQAQHTHTDSHSHTQTHSYTDNSEPGSSGLHGVPYWYQDKEGCVPMYSVPVSGNEGEVVALVQSLYTWARFEWGQKGMRGAARHLWRAAADVAHWHPRGVHAGEGLIHMQGSHRGVRTGRTCRAVHARRVSLQKAASSSGLIHPHKPYLTRTRISKRAHDDLYACMRAFVCVSSYMCACTCVCRWPGLHSAHMGVSRVRTR